MFSPINNNIAHLPAVPPSRIFYYSVIFNPEHEHIFRLPVPDPNKELVINETDCLGEGTYGQVFSGKLRGITIAVKFKKIQADDKTTDLRAEYENMASLIPSYFILKVFGTIVSNSEVIAIIMERAQCSLRTYLKSKPAAVNKAFYAFTAAKAMQELHETHGFLHRDFNADNLLIDYGHMIKISDYGSIKRMDECGNVFGNSFFTTFTHASKNLFIYDIIPVEENQPDNLWFIHDVKTDEFALYKTLWQIICNGENPSIDELVKQNATKCKLPEIIAYHALWEQAQVKDLIKALDQDAQALVGVYASYDAGKLPPLSTFVSDLERAYIESLPLPAPPLPLLHYPSL